MYIVFLKFLRALKLPLLFIIFFFVMAVINLARLKNTDFYNLGDFVNVYIGQSLIMEGKNPYNDTIISEKWERVQNTNSFKSDYSNMTPLLYPPWGLQLFTPFTILKFTTSAKLWFFLQPLLIFFTILYLFKISKLIDLRTNKLVFIEILLVIFAFKGTIQAMIYGQPFFLISFFVTCALFFQLTNKPIICGLFVGLATSKFTFAFPIWFFLLLRKDFKALAIGVITTIVLVISFYLSAQDPISIFKSYSLAVESFRSQIFASSLPGYPYHLLSRSVSAASISDIGSLLVMYIKNIQPHLPIVYFVVIFFGMIGYIINFKKFNDNRCILFLYLSHLFFSAMYIQWYDFMVLITLGWLCIRNLPTSYHYVYFIINLFQFIPIGGLIKGRSFTEPLNIIHFTLPLMTISNIIFFWLTTKYTTTSSK